MTDDQRNFLIGMQMQYPYRGYQIAPRYVAGTGNGLRYWRYVVLTAEGQPTDPPAAALSMRCAQRIIDSLNRRDEIEQIVEQTYARAMARAIPEARAHIANSRKLGRRDIDAHPLI
jgi:hypothetical protein